MTQINQQFNKPLNAYQQPLTGAGANQMPAIASDKISQGINSNPVVKNFGGEDDKNKWVIPTLFVPLFAGVSYGMKKFNEACRGTYEESLVGKMGKMGDDLGKTKFFQSGFVKGIEKAVDSTKNFVSTKIIDKSKVLTALVRTPAEATVGMVLLQQKGTIAELASAATQDFAKFTKEGTINLDKLGIKTFEEYTDLIKNPHTDANIKKVMTICEEQIAAGNKTFSVRRGFKVPLTKGKHITELLPWTAKLFPDKTVHFAEHLNKLTALSGKNKHWLGKSLPKVFLRGLESITFGNTGGKIGMAMAVGFIASAIKDTINAPKGDKGKTFAERNIYNMGFYLTMPLALNAMYHTGGLQYIGMSPEAVGAYRTKLAEFNNKAKTFAFKDKAEYKIELDKLKSMLKGDLKSPDGAGALKKTGNFFANLIRKPLKFAGKTLMVGSEMPEAYIKEGASGFSKFFSKIGYGFKNGAGYPVRFIMAMLVIAPPLANLAAKASHLVFGRPAKSVLDKEPEAKTAETAQQATAAIQSRQQLNAIPTGMPNAVAPASSSSSNLLNNYKPKTPMSVVEPVQSAPAQSANVVQPQAIAPVPQGAPAEQGIVRNYVPSSAGVVIQGNPNQPHLAPKMDENSPEYLKTVRAEHEALKVLGE